jgi:hypothetical protein
MTSNRRVISLLFAAAGALRAQAPVAATFPPVPTNVPRAATPPDPADSGFAKWRRIPLPRHDFTPAAWTLRAGEWDFLIATPRAIDAMDSSSVVEATVESCRRPLSIPNGDGDRAMFARPWAPFDSVMDDRPALVISIMPVLQNLAACGFKNVGRPAVIARGLRFVNEFAYDPTRDPRSAVVLSRLRAVRATMLARAPLTILTHDGAPRHTVDQLRLYIPYDAFAPDAVGDIPPVELLIWTKAGGPPSHIPLPPNIMRAVWQDYLRWRGARLSSRDRTAASGSAHRTLVPLPTPTDPALKTAIRLGEQNRDAESASMMLERLSTTPALSVNDRRIALMSLATTFQADDDAPAAAMLGSELMAIDPCALSGTSETGGPAVANDAYAAMRAAGGLFDGLRPDARCTPLPGWVTLWRGLLPGYGQYRSWSRAVGISTAALTVSGGITAYVFLHNANSSYAKYVATQSGFASYLRTAAKKDRRDAHTLAVAAGALWLASAIEGEVHERVVGARLHAEHDFWFRPIVGGGNAASPQGAFSAGLSLSFR